MSIGRHLYQRFKLSLACLSDWGISGGGVCCLGNVLSHSLQTLPPEIHTLPKFTHCRYLVAAVSDIQALNVCLCFCFSLDKNESYFFALST